MHLIVEQTKQNTLLPKIMRVAIRLFVEKGIDGTTIKDIAERAEVSEGALYRHFKSKDELAWHIFSTHVNEFSIDLMTRVSQGKNIQEKIRIYISTCFKAFEEDRDLFAYLIISEHRELDKFPANYVHPGHVALRLIEEGQKAGELRPMEVAVASAILLGSLMRMCVARMYDRISHSLKQYEKDVADSLWAALKK